MAKTFLRSFKKILAWALVILFFLGLALITKIDRKDFREMAYYQETMAALDREGFEASSGEYWIAGWAKVNATPPHGAALVGYKPRGKYEFVQDSSYIRAIVLENGQQRVALLNYELMIVHPFLHRKITQAIKDQSLPLEQVYMTATHTHSGIGGYMPGLMGKIAFGGYDPQVVDWLTSKTIESLNAALAKRDTVEIIYQKALADTLVANRLVAEDPIDPYIRKLVFINKKGEKALFTTYSAHATIMDRKFMGLSGDYPHYLMDQLEKDGYQMAMFAAGTVGSHKPLASGKSPKDVEAYGHAVARHSEESLVFTDTSKSEKLVRANIPLQLRKAHYKLGKNIRLRPWVFNSLFGDTGAHFDVLVLGENLLVTSSGEISGVFMEAWEKYAQEHGLNLIITCFNGGYIGYITPDKYYDEPMYEVREMNWFGPQNGAYFDEIIRKIIEKVGDGDK